MSEAKLFAAVYLAIGLLMVGIVWYCSCRTGDALVIPMDAAAQAKLAACDGAKSIVLTLEDGEIVDAQVVCR